MKKIDLQFTEDLLTPYGITVAEVAIANGYQDVVPNEDYTPAVGDPTIIDPDWVEPDDFNALEDDVPMVENPDYVPANGEPTLPNPNTHTAFIAAKLPALGMETMITKVLQPQINEAEEALRELRNQPAQIAAAIVASMTKTVTE